MLTFFFSHSFPAGEPEKCQLQELNLKFTATLALDNKNPKEKLDIQLKLLSLKKNMPMAAKEKLQKFEVPEVTMQIGAKMKERSASVTKSDISKSVR